MAFVELACPPPAQRATKRPQRGLQAGAAIPSRTIIGGKASGVGQVPEEPEVPSMALKDGPDVPWRTGRSLSSREELFGYKAAPYRIGRADLDADQAPEC